MSYFSWIRRFVIVDVESKYTTHSKAYKSFFLTLFITTMDLINTFNTPLSPLNIYPFLSSLSDIKLCFNF